MKIANSLRILVGLVGVATAWAASDAKTASNHPSSKVNLTDLPSWDLKRGEPVLGQDEQGNKDDELPTIAELVQNQKASIQVDRQVNLRHRLLSTAGQIRPVFGNSGKCVDRRVDNNNLYLHTCHTLSNQKFTYDANTKQIKVDGLCLDDTGLAGRNVWVHACHDGNNQKWRTDNKGRIQGLHDYSCLDVASDGNLYMRGCCDNCEGQRWYVPQHFPTSRSEIHPVLNSAACWDIGGMEKNLYVNGNCHTGENQQFYYSPYSQSIFLPLTEGSGCLDENYITGNVYANGCLHGNNQKWWMDSYGRIRNRHDTMSRCMEQNSSGNNLRMVGCNDNDNQRFIVPHETFPVAASQVKPFYDLGKCWDSGPDKNLYLASSCISGNFHQQFYFMAQSERIYDAYGNGCLDDQVSGHRNVFSHPCHSGNNQKWYADSLGRLRGRSDNKCLTIDSSNLVMKDCNDSIYQRFVVPASFPRVTSPVKSAFNTGLCLAVMSDRKVMARSCRGDKDEDFFYVPDSERIFVASGQGCLDPTANNNVIVHPCHGQNNQKWYMDEHGRIRDKHYHHCLTRASNNNLEHRGCDDSDSQRLVLPESFPVSTSVVKPFNNDNLCWGLANDNIMIVPCSSTQNFFFAPESGRIIHLPSGKCVDDAGSGGRNIYLGSCHDANNQKFFVDHKGRIHSRRDGKCIDINTDNNLFVRDCNDNDSQRFIYAISFKTILSPVTPYADQTKCWDIGGTGNNLYLYPCHKGRNQDFFYIPSTEQIMAGHGTGCLTDESSGGRNVFFGACGTGNNQKWYMDAQGRLHSRIDEIKCLDLNKSTNNLYMEVCNDSFSQRFSYPNSFPIVATNARTAYDRRQELNRIYGTVERHIYGEDSRSIIRYNHPDQVRRNLCPYWESSFSFNYTMQNYALSTSSVIEVKSTSDMDQLLLDETRVTSGVTKVLVVKRPKLQTGYFRLGDYASNSKAGPDSSLLVKGADGTVLKEPTDFVLVWNGTSGDVVTPTSSGSFWKPVAPAGFTCLGHVWQQGTTKPATNLVRCIQDRFVESAPSSLLFDNDDAASKARSEVDLSVRVAGSTATSFTPGTFVSKASHSAPATEEFKSLKKGCILGEGAFPFCDANDSLSLTADASKDFKIPYAKLQPCYYEHEDQVGYGLVNEDTSKWQNHAIELFNIPAGSLGYKHVGASTNLGEPYCLGSVVFGSSSIKHDLFIHGITKVGSVTQQEAEDQKNGALGNHLSKMISGDFVFLFPCSGKNSVKEYKTSLAALATSANTNGGSENGVVNANENLGELELFGGSKWTSPHYCGISEEPTASGGCRKVDVCFFEPGGCKPYDQLPCTKNTDCKGGICNLADKLCGDNLNLYASSVQSNSRQTLQRASSYGIGQDGPGRFLVQEAGNRIQLSGNVWKAFPMAEHTVSYSSVLEFDFRLVDEVEGHAICLDEDLNEDVEIQGSKRCFRLGGTQSAIWKEVWNLDHPGSTGEFKHYKVKIGSLTGGAGTNEPYISWGAKIKFIGIVQDNDANENIGESTFKNLQLYHDSAAPVETVDPGPSITGTSIEIDVSNPTSHGNWKVGCTRLDGSVPDQPPQSVYKYDGKSFNAGTSTTNFKYKLDGLLSGYEYTAKLFPVDSSGNQLQGSTPQETVASTYCCCNCNSIIVGDTTGRPIGLKAYQVKGFVMFNFIDNSLCAEAYAFTRSSLEDEFFDNSDETRKSVFTPNYNYYPKKKCGGAPVLPGKAAADDLRTSSLVVGAAYRYCVRAVAQFYSADSLHSSDENCNIHFVCWQASMSGKVTTAPLAGSLPIEDVAVSWELLNPQLTVVIASGSAVTKRPGTYSIEFDELHTELDRDNEFPVRIKFSKATTVGNDTITHQFLCNEGSTDCTDGTIVYLKHLTFEEPVVSYDNSSVPVRGRVTIWEPSGCPVIGAEVCLKIKHTQTADTTGACVKTDHNGDYNVPAAIGSTVGIEVSYNNHTMNKAPENSLDYNKGVFINVNKRYVRNDFVDVAKAKLVVEVVGGLCNKTLGVSRLEATVNGCDRTNWKMDLSQKFFKGEHWVPAHVLDLKVVGMSNDAKNDFSKILDFFATKNMTKTIDLLDAGDMQDETNRVDSSSSSTSEQKSEGSKSKESYDKVRFQYDGDLVMDFRFMGVDLAESCTLQTVKPQGTLISGTETTTSFHVTTTGSTFRPKVFLKYSLLPGLTCDIFSDEIAVRVINKIGIDADFEKYASTLQSKAVLLNRLKLCSDDGGCNFPVNHDIINGKKTNAHMLPRKDDGTVVAFAAGRPNLYGDFRKDLTLEVLDKNLKTLKTHRAEVVVIGDYVKGPGESFALPTYKPILILRDPPGGLSQSIYENVQTSIKVKSSTVERVKDTTFHYDRSVGGEHEYSMCAGFGAMACKDVLEIEGEFETGLGLDSSTVQQDDEDSYTSEFTTTWSYATSDDPVLAGRKSDVIVIPNLNVQYHIVTTVAFYGGTSCQVNTTDTVKFSLTDPGNKPALSFLSVYNIETHQLPDLKKAISDKKAEHDKLAANHPNKTKTKTQLKVLEDALTGWNQTMTDYDSINKNASKNKLDIAGREWFTKWASTKDMMEKEPTITDHWSNLAPEVLTDRTEAFDFDYIKQAKLASTDKTDLKETNRIQFSGGGGTVEFVVDHAGASELMRLDKTHKNGAVSSTATLEGEMEISAGASFGVAIGGGFTYESSTSGTVTDESGRQTTVSFLLGDEQPNDEFVVDIFVDPTYGTFVFHTVSGCSRAPWEPNTKKGEDLSMSMVKPDGPVMPDDAVVIDVTLLNAGETMAVFQAYVDHTTNPGGLRHFMGGVGLDVPIDYTLGARSEITTKVEIRRGPKGYKFPSTTMYLVSLWDELGIEAGSVEIFNFVDANNKKWILFEEPCPRVEWAGSLKREKKASVIKNVKPVDLTVFNPQKADGTFESIAKNSRLSNVYAWYRQLGDIGDTSWKKAQLADKTHIDFANIPNVSSYKESPYGYSKIPWDIGTTLASTGDGAYEVMVESVCETLPGAPDEFNKFQSDLITLVVDRVQPELYGKALPIRDVVVPGEEIVLVFTESIQCELPYRFFLNVTVAGLDPPLFNERDLKIDCQGRKLGFQFDPTQTGGGWDVLMGKEMTVTVDQIKDLEGNVLPNKITFQKTLANLNLQAVTSTFDFRLATSSCTSPVDEAKVKNKIATELALSDSSRVTVVSSSCDGTTTVAKVKISPTSGRRLRNEEEEGHNAMSAFYALLKLSSGDTGSRSRKLISLDGADYFTFSVDNMELVPGEADLKKYGLNAELTPEEEMILAAADACDSNHLEQRHQLLKMEHTVREHLNQTESHIDRMAKETDAHIEDLETHLEELDHKLDEIDQKMEGKLDEIVARLLETKTQTPSESVRPEHVELPDEKQDLTVLLAQLREEQMLLAQLREEQMQSRFCNIVLGLSLLVGMVVSLYVRAGR